MNVWAATLYAVVKMKKSVRIAFCGVVTALVCVMMSASLIPNITFAVPAIAGLIMIPVFAEAGAVSAFLSFFASSIISFFISNKTSWLLFVVFFGFYPILKPLIEKVRIVPLKWALKFLIFNFSACICALVQYNTIGLQFKGWCLVAAFVAGNIAFLLYDSAVLKIAAVYYLRLHNKISSILNNR